MSWDPRTVPEERPSSFDETGKRVFLYPAKVEGKYKKRRTAFYYFLLLIFLVVPWTTFNGEQTIFFDLAHRRFIFFGKIFVAHDGPLIFFPLILSALSLVFVTSIWGRLWCGWACPQTVFLEAIFRRIDQWIEGPHLKRIKLDRAPWTLSKFTKKAVKWFLFFLVCSHSSHSFTAYFVGAKSLFWLTTASPLNNLTLFIFVQVVTLMLLFNFGWFREQFCIIMCPYGRFQSVLMGQQSLAVLYDEKRGEPHKAPGVKNPGDCINCYKCVSACPTGIDIRRGVQMECIACTACIDACDEVMDKLKKPRGLIRYSSLDSMARAAGEKVSKFNIRSAVYFALILLIAAAFVNILSNRTPLDIKTIRAIEAPYNITNEHLVNHFVVVLTNQTGDKLTVHSPQIEGGSVVAPGFPFSLEPGKIERTHVFLKVSKDIKGEIGKTIEFTVEESSGKNFEVKKDVKILGPK